jgi:hypothetical protein
MLAGAEDPVEAQGLHVKGRVLRGHPGQQTSARCPEKETTAGQSRAERMAPNALRTEQNRA